MEGPLRIWPLQPKWRFQDDIMTKAVKTKNAVLNYHDLSLVHETQKILPISDAMFEKGKKFSGGGGLP